MAVRTLMNLERLHLRVTSNHCSIVIHKPWRASMDQKKIQAALSRRGEFQMDQRIFAQATNIPLAPFDAVDDAQ